MPLSRILLIALLALPWAVNAQNLYKWIDKNGRVNYSDQPPPPGVRDLQEPTLRSAVIDTSGLPFETQQAARNFPVTLYSSSECQQECDMARNFLRQRGVPFLETALNTSEQTAAFRQRFASESILVPSITIGNLKQQGFEAARWNALLDSAGYARTAIPGTTAAQSPAASDSEE